MAEGMDAFRVKENQWFGDFLKKTLEDGCGKLKELQNSLKWKDSALTWLNIIMFLVGILLTTIPLFSYILQGEIEQQNLISGGLGAAELVALWMINPIKRTHKYMGDYAEISIAINSFVNQIACIIIATDIRDEYKKESFTEAVEMIRETTKETMSLVQKYFEETPIAEID